jgi:hypothetical protein
MNRPNPAVYPITANLVDAVIEAGYENLPVAIMMVETVGEYEHGTADVEDVCEQEPINIKQYAAVVLDMILTIGAQS